MSILRSVIGTFTQSMGGVTFSTWKDKNVGKQKVASTNTSNTPAQAKQRSKFAALAILGGLFGPSVRIGYRMSASSMTEQNAFYSANKGTVTYANGVATVDLAALSISTGSVAPLSGFSGQYNALTGELSFGIDDNSNGDSALPTDLLFFAAYDTVNKKGYNIGPAGTRAEGSTATLELPTGLVPANIRVYGFAKRATNTSASPSVNALATV